MVDDDFWRRGHMSKMLNDSPEISVVHSLHQDEAAAWSSDRWADIDLAIIDVIDEAALGEVGTDVYSGIVAIDRLRSTKVVTIALTPHRSHPLVEFRIFEAGADFVYRRWEVNDPTCLIDVVLHPDSGHAPRRPANATLTRFGARGAKPNRAVELLERSPLAGRLIVGASHRTVRIPRRELDRFRRDIHRTGFESTEMLDDVGGTVNRAARWPDTRDYVLRLLGRKDTPSTDHDTEP